VVILCCKVLVFSVKDDVLADALGIRGNKCSR
jgi:hypothetical protein